MHEKAIDQFLFAPEFKSLLTLKSKFSEFQALGVQRRELSHSDFLAYLFDPSQPHQCGSSILRGFLETAFQETRARSEPQRLLFGEIAALDYNEVRVCRELDRIDLILAFPKSGTVFGIENKIDHVEGGEQLRRYQSALAKRFAKATYPVRILFFLTPDGREGLTADINSDVKCVPISYGCVAAGLSEGIYVCRDDDVKCFIKSAVRHVREELMNEGPEKDLVRKLWRNEEYAKTFARIFIHRPRLSDIRQNWVDKVSAYVTTELKSLMEWKDWSPQNGELSEIDLFITSWKSKNLDFALKLYCPGFNWIEKTGLRPPAFRVLLQQNLLLGNQKIYQSFAQSNPEVVDPEYPRISGWSGWRKVLKEEDFPQDANINDLSFSDTTVDLAFHKFIEKVNVLNPLVEQFSP